MDSNLAQTSLRIDAHVHIIGNGSGGTGCWLKLSRAYHKLLAKIILSGFGLPQSALRSGVDRVYVERLAGMARSSSIDAAVILAHENVYDERGRILTGLGSFYTPNEYVLSLAREYPDCFIPAVAIHPARADALDQLEFCIASGAALLKLLPNCQNVNCNDQRFAKFWQRLASAGIPFLAHTGGELSVPVVNAAYADPRTLTLPLECGVNVIAAHCGSRALIFDRSYVRTFLEMLERYSNLYGDNSGMNTPLRAAYFKQLLSAAVQQRIVHGSDLPIPISAFWSLLRGRVTCSDWLASRATDNLIERDALIKDALGFEQQTFSRIAKLLPAAALSAPLRAKQAYSNTASVA